jgi:signal transduction histidine kinase/DNA-binding response OmpR family regulator
MMDSTMHSSPSARILIVDDHPNTASMLARAFQKMDASMEVITALSGEDALVQAGGRPVDVLITDFMMPGMNGLELVEKFNGEHKPAHTILMTAYDTPGLAVTARTLGIEHYLVKPVLPEKIKEIVDEMLQDVRQSQAAAAQAAKARRFKILIADDNPDNLQLFSMRLKKDGYDYLTAADGQETLASARAERPDLILLDVNMPKKDGFQVLAELRADPETATMPVIIVTAGRISPNDVQEGLTLGADDYVTKPVDWRELAARIRSKLRVKEAEDALRRKNRELSILPAITQELSAHLDIDGLVEQTLDRTQQALGASDAFAVIFQPDGSLFERASRGQEPGLADKKEGQAVQSFYAQVAASQEGIIIKDATTDQRWELPVEGNVRSLLAVPLLGRRDALGVLILTHEQADYFRPDHLALLQAIANQAAIAIENAQLYASEHKRVQELVALNMLSRQISSFTSSKTLLDTFPRLVQATLGYPLVTLWLSEPQADGSSKLVLRSQASSGTAWLVPGEVIALAPQQVANTGRSALVSGVVTGGLSRYRGKTTDLANPYAAIRSAAAVPLLMQEKVTGVLAAHSPKAGVIQESDRVLLETLAAQIVQALERIQLFESVAQQKQRLAAVLNSVAEAILVLDDQGRLELTNPAGQRLFTDINSRVGQPLPAGKGYDELVGMLSQARQSADPAEGEITWPDERTFAVSITSIDAGGRVALLNDVSHFKALDQLKNEFIATASHDLKNPIFAVLGYSDLIVKVGPLTEMQADFLRRIRSSAAQMQELVVSLLEMARLEMGIELDMHKVDLHALLRQVQDEFQPQAQIKGQVLALELAPETPLVMGDARRLQQAARNLVGNAIKYTAPGGMIFIRSKVHGGEVAVEVQDTGIGIPPWALQNLFTKFYRVRNEQTQDIEGNGLGLAIVKSIVERHGGRIGVESALGIGSCFRVHLKLAGGG